MLSNLGKVESLESILVTGQLEYNKVGQITWIYERATVFDVRAVTVAQQ